MLKVEYQGAVVTCDTVDEAVAFVRGVTPVTSVGFEADRFVIYDPRKKPDDGWVEWHGGDKSPVENGPIVTVKFRGGTEETDNEAADWNWSHVNGDYDIIAYRVVGSN